MELLLIMLLLVLHGSSAGRSHVASVLCRPPVHLPRELPLVGAGGVLDNRRRGLRRLLRRAQHGCPRGQLRGLGRDRQGTQRERGLPGWAGSDDDGCYFVVFYLFASSDFFLCFIRLLSSSISFPSVLFTCVLFSCVLLALMLFSFNFVLSYCLVFCIISLLFYGLRMILFFVFLDVFSCFLIFRFFHHVGLVASRELFCAQQLSEQASRPHTLSSLLPSDTRRT